MKVEEWFKSAFLEGPGETFTKGKWKVFPVLHAAFEPAVIILNVHSLGWVGLLYVPIYLALAWCALALLHYSDHGSPWISYPAAVFEWLTIAMLALTCFGFLAVQGIYAVKVREDQQAEQQYQKTRAQYLLDLKDYKDWEEQREKDRNLRAGEKTRQLESLRALAQEEKERAKYAAIQSGNALKLYRETGQKIKTAPTSGSVVTDALSAGDDGAIWTDRKAPVEPKQPVPAAEQFLSAWLLWLKLGQVGEFLVDILGFLFLILGAKWVNRRFRTKGASEEEISVMEAVVPDGRSPAELLASLPQVSPSLSTDDDFDDEEWFETPDMEFEESREEGVSQSLPRSPKEETDLPKVSHGLGESPTDFGVGDLVLPFSVDFDDSTTAITKKIEELQLWETQSEAASLQIEDLDESEPLSQGELEDDPGGGPETDLQAYKDFVLPRCDRFVLGSSEIAEVSHGIPPVSHEPEEVSHKSPTDSESLPKVSHDPEPGLPQDERREDYRIGRGQYSLKQKYKNKRPMGFDLRHVTPLPGQRRDICYVGQVKGLEILTADPDRQLEIVQELIAGKEKKETGLLPRLRVVV